MFGAHAGLRIANEELGEESNSVVLWQAARIAGHPDPTFVILSEAKNLLCDGSEFGRPVGATRTRVCAPYSSHSQLSAHAVERLASAAEVFGHRQGDLIFLRGATAVTLLLENVAEHVVNLKRGRLLDGVRREVAAQ
jgi:hypothetical protein